MPRPAKPTAHPSLFADFESPSSPAPASTTTVSTVKSNSTQPPAQRKRAAATFTTTQELLSRYQLSDKNKHIAYEFQSFGCHLAESLADKPHTALYIKLAKQLPRALLEQALRFVIDANADNKARLFMWKLNQLKQSKLDQQAKQP